MTDYVREGQCPHVDELAAALCVELRHVQGEERDAAALHIDLCASCATQLIAVVDVVGIHEVTSRPGVTLH